VLARQQKEEKQPLTGGPNEGHAREIDRLKDNRERVEAFRKDFRNGIAIRSQKFRHRMVEFAQPVLIAHLLMLILFGFIAAVAFYQLTITGLSEEPGVIAAAFAVFFSLAFWITTARMANWHRHWREQEDARELQLLRMSLDVERLYLAVEMALESKSRPGEMSDELLEKLFVKTSMIAD
jgi:hypothetical protein